MLRVLGSPRPLCDGLIAPRFAARGRAGTGGTGPGGPVAIEDAAAAAAEARPARSAGPSRSSCCIFTARRARSSLSIPSRMPRSRFAASWARSRRACRLRRVRAVAELRQRDGSHRRCCAGDASLSAARRGLRPDGHAGDRCADGAQPDAIRGIGRSSARSSITSSAARRQRAGTTAQRRVPNNIALPFRFSSHRVGEVPRAGPYAAFLGNEYDPVWTDFVGQATKGLTKTLAQQRFDDNDPYIGLSPDSHFVVPSATALRPEMTLDRLDRRRTPWHILTGPARPDRERRRAAFDRYRQMTYRCESDDLRSALDVRREPDATRDMYGRTLFGQACLAARRLVEAGSRMVSVFWDEYGLAGSGWDTHWNHYPRMRQELCPGLDLAWYGLITDLDRARIARRYAGRLHQRAWPHAPHRQRAGGRPGPLVAGLFRAVGRRRYGPGPGGREPRTSMAATWPITRSVPKICWPRCTTCWASITPRRVHDAEGGPLPLVDGQVISAARWRNCHFRARRPSIRSRCPDRFQVRRRLFVRRLSAQSPRFRDSARREKARGATCALLGKSGLHFFLHVRTNASVWYQRRWRRERVRRWHTCILFRGGRRVIGDR